MTIYYIVPPSTSDSTSRIALDATTSVQLDEVGKTTDLPLETGESVTDHYVNKPTKISFSGVISTAKSSGNKSNKTPEDYIKDIRALKQSGEAFTVFFSDKLNPLTNCVFQSISISQSKKSGTSGGSSSYRVAVTVKQVRFAQQAALVVQTDARIQDDFDEEGESGRGTQESGIRNTITGTELRDIGLEVFSGGVL